MKTQGWDILFPLPIGKKGIIEQRPWRVLLATANHEKKVAQHLSVRALERYLPLHTGRSCWTDRTVIAILWPGVAYPTSIPIMAIFLATQTSSRPLFQKAKSGGKPGMVLLLRKSPTVALDDVGRLAPSDRAVRPDSVSLFGKR